MRQVWFLISAIFMPLGALVRVLEPVLAWLRKFDETLNDPDLLPDLRDSASGRRTVEGAIAFGEYWLNIIIACRTVELLGLRRSSMSKAGVWEGWRPHAARSWRGLMQRYARLRAGFTTIERDACRRAARIRGAMSANPLGLRDDLMIIRVEGSEGVIIAPCPHADARESACVVTLGARGPPFVLALAPEI